MVNEFFTLLSRGTSNEYGRLVEGNVYRAVPTVSELHSTMVPESDDKFIVTCTEQLLQAVLQSPYADSLQTLDTSNTYEFEILELVDNSYEVINSSDMTATVLNENTDDPKWAEKSFTINVDGSAQTASVASRGLPTTTYEFEMINGLSSKILLADKVYLRLQGTLPAASFTISVQYSQKFTRDLNDLAARLENINIPWANVSYTDAYMESKFVIDKIAIVSMSLYEMLRNGSS